MEKLLITLLAVLPLCSMAQSETPHPLAILESLGNAADSRYKMVWTFNGELELTGQSFGSGQSFGGNFVIDLRSGQISPYISSTVTEQDGHVMLGGPEPYVVMGDTKFTQVVGSSLQVPANATHLPRSVSFASSTSTLGDLSGTPSFSVFLETGFRSTPDAAQYDLTAEFLHTSGGPSGSGPASARLTTYANDSGSQTFGYSGGLPLVPGSAISAINGVLWSQGMLDHDALIFKEQIDFAKEEWRQGAELAKHDSDVLMTLFDGLLEDAETRGHIHSMAADRVIDTAGVQTVANTLAGLLILKDPTTPIMEMGFLGLSVIDYLAYSQHLALTEKYGDPPDSNYFELVQSSGEKLDLGFAERYSSLDAALGSGLDEAFETFGLGLESEERLLITLERLQGAMLAKSIQGIELQSTAALSIFEEQESIWTLASNQFSSLANLFAPINAVLHDALVRMSELAGLSRPSSTIDAIPEPDPDTNPPVVSVPDAGSTMLLLGMALTIIGGIHRKFKH